MHCQVEIKYVDHVQNQIAISKISIAFNLSSTNLKWNESMIKTSAIQDRTEKIVNEEIIRVDFHLIEKHFYWINFFSSPFTMVCIVVTISWR